MLFLEIPAVPGGSLSAIQKGRYSDNIPKRKELTFTSVDFGEHRGTMEASRMACLWISETAKVLGLSEANVKTRLCRARLQMRDVLAPGFDGAWTRGKAYEKVRPF